VPFSIDFVTALEILGVIHVALLQERLFWWDIVKKLSPAMMWTINLSKKELTIQRWLGGAFEFSSGGTKRQSRAIIAMLIDNWACDQEGYQEDDHATEHNFHHCENCGQQACSHHWWQNHHQDDVHLPAEHHYCR